MSQKKSLNITGNETSLCLNYSEIQEIPKAILQCAELESLTINGTYHLPEWLSQLTSLESLAIYGEYKELPDWLERLTQLKRLELSGYFTELPAVVTRLTSLTELILEDNQLATLPDSMLQLEQLIELDLCQNQFTEFPAILTQMPSLLYLSLFDNLITKVSAPVIAFCEQLDDFSILGTLPVFTLPIDIVFASKKVQGFFSAMNVRAKQLYSGINRIAKILSRKQLTDLLPNIYYNITQKTLFVGHAENPQAIDINLELGNFFAKLKQEQLSTTHIQHFYYLLIQHPEAANLDRKQLLELIDTKTKVYQKLVIHQLAQTSPTLQEKPLAPDCCIRAIGKTVQAKKAIQSLLQAYQIVYHSRTTPDTTHILLGANPKLSPKEQREDVVYLTESDLQTYVNEVNTPYLLQEGTTDTHSNQKIRELLLSTQESNIGIALGMLEGLGLPKELLTLVFAVYKESEEKENRQLAKQLLTLYGDAKLKRMLGSRKSLVVKTIANQDKRNEDTKIRLQFFAEQAGLDAVELLYFIYRKTGDFEALLLEMAAHSPFLLELLQTMKKNDLLHIKGSVNLASVLPKVYQIPTLKTLVLEEFRDRKLASGISQLKQLNAFSLKRNRFTSTLPEDFSDLENLEILTLWQVDITRLPQDIGKIRTLKHMVIRYAPYLNELPTSLYELPNLIALHLKAVALQKGIAPQISQLQSLRQLCISNIEKLSIPLKNVYELAQLTTLELTMCNLSQLPEGISQLAPTLKKLRLSNNPLKKLPPDIADLQQLDTLDIGHLRKLRPFPKEIYELTNLKTLNMPNHGWNTIPEGISQLKNLTHLNFSYSNWTHLPHDIVELNDLEVLDIQFCNKLRVLPQNLEKLTNLKMISVSGIDKKLVSQLKEIFQYTTCQIYG